MDIKKFVIEAVILLVITIVVSAVLDIVYGIVDLGSGKIDWELAIRTGLLLGLVIPISRVVKNKL